VIGPTAFITVVGASADAAGDFAPRAGSPREAVLAAAASRLLVGAGRGAAIMKVSSDS
jgi:hypothetical protein